MPRTHGRNSRLYVDLTGSGAATPVPFVTNVSLDASTDKVDVTAMGDTNKVYVVGLPDSSGSYSGWWDSGTAGLFTAATDGNARKFYFYPDATNTPGQYFYGTAFFDTSTSTGVGDAVAVSGSITAASKITLVTGP
jgi:hypothetical protein